jgi:cytochrome c553
MANRSSRSISRLQSILALLAFAGSSLAFAADSAPPVGPADVAKGKEVASTVCAGCHNADGNSTTPTFPKLAGQSADYIVKQLIEFSIPATQKNARDNAIMSGMAATLTPQDRINVAAWFASQPAWTPGAASDKLSARDGQRLFRAGYPPKAVPACAGCHGPTGNGLPARFPRLGGQHADYIEAQLRAFRDGSRHNNEVMEQIAFRLSDPEIKALSQFIAGLRSQ